MATDQWRFKESETMLDILKYLAVAEIEGEAPAEEVLETPVEGTAQEETAPAEPSPITEIDIDGEKYSIDDVKSWKTSNMASSDYLEKVNALEREKEQHRDALELFSYMKERPDLVKKLYELDAEAPKVKTIDPQMSEIGSLKTEIAKMKIEKELEILKIREPEVNEMEVLKLAVDNRVDISTATTMWKGKNFDKILQSKLKEQSKNLAKEISTNNSATKSLIKKGDGVSNTGDSGLSEMELMFAKKMDMTPEEYKRWKR